MKFLSINEFAEDCYQVAKDHGFHEVPVTTEYPATYDSINLPQVAMRIALIHSEGSEILEDLRRGKPVEYAVDDNGKPVGVASEIADTIIRCLDLAHALGIDIQDALEKKHAYNLTRSNKHGSKLF